jgi:hypothetical protein
VDRFLPYEFGSPPQEVLVEVARHRADRQELTEDELNRVVAAIVAPDSSIRSIRDVERTVTRAYVASIVGHEVQQVPIG